MYVGWRDAVQARGRVVLMVGVVMLIALLVGLLSGLTAGLARESTSAISGLSTERLVFSGSSPDFSTSRVPAASGVEGDSLGVSTTRATADGTTTPVAAFGVEAGSSVAPDAAGTGHGRVVVTTPLAEELHLREGDSVRIGLRDHTVAAIRGDASHAHLPVVWMQLDDWASATGLDAPTVVATESATAPAGFTSVTLEDSLAGIGSYTSENGSLQLIRGFLFGISALVVGAFFTVWTVQRARDIAVLKAIGASNAFLLRDALGQAALLLGTGVTLGAVLAAIVGAVVGDTVPFLLDPRTLGGPLVVLVLLGLSGAALAVRRVVTVDPLTALGSAR